MNENPKNSLAGKTEKKTDQKKDRKKKGDGATLQEIVLGAAEVISSILR